MSNLRILIAEDDLDDILLIREALKEKNSSVTVDFVNNGLELLRRFKQRKEQGNLPHLIVSDFNMPKMNGLEALLSLKRDGLTNIPCILYSTSDLLIYKQSYEEAGVTAFIRKPQDFDGFLELVERFLEYGTV